MSGSKQETAEIKEQLIQELQEAQKVLIGIGGEWKSAGAEAYSRLYDLVKDKDYYVVTTLTDGVICSTEFGKDRITAPCGNVHWLQCSKACTRDIWEEGEVPDGICPHCGEPLTANTVEAETYIEEGYLPGWEACKHWQAAALNKKLVILELGEGFQYPTVMRWPFEKIAFFNQKSRFWRINRRFSQLPGDIQERSQALDMDSVEFITLV